MKHLCYSFILFIALLSCSQENADYTSRSEKASAESQSKLKSTEAPFQHFNLEDTLLNGKKHLVRKADISMAVGNADSATALIENIIRNAGGYILQSNLEQRVVSTRETRITADTLLTTSKIEKTGHLYLRIPFQYFDNAIHHICQLADRVHHRNISAEDVTLQLLNHQLTRLQQNNFSDQMADLSKEDGEGDRESMLDNALRKKIKAKEARLLALQTQNDIFYSEVTLTLYQDTEWHQTTSLRPQQASVYEMPYSTKAAAAFQQSLDWLKALSVILIKVWFLIPLLFVLYYRVMLK